MKHVRLIYPDAGLGNRLYCLYSGLYWRKKLGIDIDILWEIEYACCIPFNKLFKDILGIKIKTVYTLSLKGKHVWKSIIGKTFIKFLKKRSYYFSSEKTSQLYKYGGEEGIEKVLTGYNDFCIKANEAYAEMLHLTEVIDILKPAEDIERKVNDIMSQFINKEVIGVHIRRTDNISAIKNSPLEAFIACMKKLQDTIPDVIFYVATDDKEVEKSIMQRFPVIAHSYFSNEKSRRTENGMKDAYVDMLCLSKCKKIYGSFGSSFSQVAALIGGIECIIVC